MSAAIDARGEVARELRQSAKARESTAADSAGRLSSAAAPELERPL